MLTAAAPDSSSRASPISSSAPPDSEGLAARRLYGGGHRFPFATDDRAASRSDRRTSPQVTDQAVGNGDGDS